MASTTDPRDRALREATAAGLAFDEQSRLAQIERERSRRPARRARWLMDRLNRRRLAAAGQELERAHAAMVEASIEWLNLSHAGPQEIPPFGGLAQASPAMARALRHPAHRFFPEAAYYERQATCRGYVLPYHLPSFDGRWMFEEFWRHADELRRRMSPEEHLVVQDWSYSAHRWPHAKTSPDLDRLAEVVARYDGLPAPFRRAEDGSTILYRTEVYAEAKMAEEEDRARSEGTEPTMRARKRYLDGLRTGDRFSWTVHPRSASLDPSFALAYEGPTEVFDVAELGTGPVLADVHFLVLARSGMVTPRAANPQEGAELEVMLPTTTTYRVVGREQHSFTGRLYDRNIRHRTYIVLDEEPGRGETVAELFARRSDWVT